MESQLAPQSKVAISPREQQEQLDRILGSRVFQTATSLQKFLDYITRKSIAGLSSDIKEYSVGIDVFQRPPGYDPKTDTVVRTQAHRLREKLTEYYDGEGVRDEVILEIPKGHYVPSFRRRTSAPSFQGFGEPAPGNQQSFPASPVMELPKQDRTLGSGRVSRRASILLAGLLIASGIFLLGILLGSHWRLSSPESTQAGLHANAFDGKEGLESLSAPVAAFWAGFMNGGNVPLVAFSDSVFVSTQSGDLLRLKSEYNGDSGVQANPALAHKLVVNSQLFDRAGPVFYEDLHTGTGEVMAAYYLTRLFTQAQCPLILKRSRLVTIDDLTRHNAIFIGSTREDALLAGLPLSQHFTFSEGVDPKRMWSIRIINLHPHAGEKQSYEVERDVNTGALRADYALVSLLPGLKPGRKMVILGGLTTAGTQAAAEFVTSSVGIAELLSNVDLADPRSTVTGPHFFQAVLRVQIMKGDLLSVKYVTGRVITSNSQFGTP